MAQVIKEIQVEVSKPNFFQAIVAKQFDTGSRWLRVTMVDNGEKITVADTSTVTINARRSDGGENKFVGSVDRGQGTVLVPLAYWMLELEGTVKSDVSVTDASGIVLTTTNFTIEVERASCQSGSVSPDEADVTVLQGLINEVTALKGDILPETTYSPTSRKAMSGVAVAEALKTVEIDVDKEMSNTSTAPVQNKTIKLYVDKEIEKIKNPETNIDDIDNVPDYWKSCLKTKTDKIHQVMENAGRNKSAFLFYSDAHWSSNSKMSPKVLKYLHKNTAINKTFFGGDIVATESADRDTMKYLYEWRKMTRELPNHHSVVGNHDDGNSSDDIFSEDYIYAYLLAPEEEPNIVYGDGMYYYIDNNAEKTRYLFLDTGYRGNNNDETYMSNQLSFIKNALETTQNGWHIVAISHIWFSPNYTKYNTGARPMEIERNADDSPKFDTYISSILSMFDEYNAGANGGKIEFCIGGHVHVDYVDKSSGGIPIIVVEADCIHDRSDFPYVANSTAESSVNGIIADYGTNTLNVIRVGRGNSFEVNLTDAKMIVKCSITRNLTNVTPSNDATEVIMGEPYNITLTPTVGKIRSYKVEMGGVDVTSLYYSNGTISIAEVTGDIVITALASKVELYTIETKLSNVSADIDETTVEGNKPFETTLKMTGKADTITSVVVTMGGVDITNSVYNADSGVISIEKVTGNIVIKAFAVENVLDTVGYTSGVRLNSSGGTTDKDGRYVTGFIPCVTGNIIYMKNVTAPLTNTDYVSQVAMYDANQEFIAGTSYDMNLSEPITTNSDNNITSFTVNEDSDGVTAYIRICAQDINENSVISVGNPIT